MKPISTFLLTGCICTCLTHQQYAQAVINTGQILDSKQQSIVTISAFTANGDLTQLQKALNEGLDAGLTVNEGKEILVHFYAYAGFPRSLNAITTLQKVITERKQKGINDPEGKENRLVIVSVWSLPHLPVYSERRQPISKTNNQKNHTRKIGLP